MLGRSEVHLLEYRSNHVVPMVWWSSQAKERFVEQPIFVFVECWIAHGREDDSAFVVREDGIAESVFAVTLLEDTFEATAWEVRRWSESYFNTGA